MNTATQDRDAQLRADLAALDARHPKTMTTPDGLVVKVGDLVTGLAVGGKRRQQLVVRNFTILGDDLALVSGLVPYASTFTEGGTYEGSYRGKTVVQLDTIQAA